MADERYPQVRVKATGELGHIAERDSSSFFMHTHVDHNTTSVWVFFEETGEFRAFRKASLEYVTE